MEIHLVCRSAQNHIFILQICCCSPRNSKDHGTRWLVIITCKIIIMINHYFVHSSIAIFRLMGLLAFIVYKIIIIIIIIINFTRSRRSEPQRARRVDQKRSIIDYALHASCIPLGSFPGCVGGAGYETSKVQCSYHHDSLVPRPLPSPRVGRGLGTRLPPRVQAR